MLYPVGNLYKPVSKQEVFIVRISMAVIKKYGVFHVIVLLCFIVLQQYVSGAAGVTGATGATGPTGPTGPAGRTGASGRSGWAGRTGSTGSTGPPGSRGFPGPIGSTGATGRMGWTGATGMPGPPGRDARDGRTGATGAIGRDGTPGRDGITGPVGPVGSTGPVGPMGPAGKSEDLTNNKSILIISLIYGILLLVLLVAVIVLAVLLAKYRAATKSQRCHGGPRQGGHLAETPQQGASRSPPVRPAVEENKDGGGQYEDIWSKESHTDDRPASVSNTDDVKLTVDDKNEQRGYESLKDRNSSHLHGYAVIGSGGAKKP